MSKSSSHLIRYFLSATLLLSLVVTGSRKTLSKEPYLTGQLLVATPEMKDPRFAQTVIYMIKHSKKGAMGLVINRPLARWPISNLLKGLGLESDNANGEITIHFGGPVQPSQAFVLHSNEYVDDGTIVLQGGVAVTGNTEVLRAIAGGKGPRNKLLIMGYAGWGPEQLEEEIEANAWFTIPTDKELIFDQQIETKWERARAKRKIAL